MAPSTAAYPTPTLREKLDLLPALGSLVFTTISALLTGWRRGPDDEPSLYLHVVYAAVRKLVVRLSSPQQQWVFPDTDAVYKHQAASFKLTPRTVELRHGAKGHWIGDPDARVRPRLVSRRRLQPPRAQRPPRLLHDARAGARGPGRLLPRLQPRPGGHVPRAAAAGGRGPEVRCRRGAPALARRRRRLGRDLVAGVLSHLAHRHAEIDDLSLAEPLAAAVMMAPWTALDGQVLLSPYNGADVLDAPALKYWAEKYMGARAPDYYTDASSAPADWFRGLPVGRILVLAGQNEILLPSINAFVKTLEAGYGPVEFYVAEREAHIAPFVNLNFYCGAPTGQGDKLQSWLDAWLDEVVASRSETAHL
ncbi:hypothetical protein J3458_015567 [Metarhizium acridum]|uniref:uncharacterized protein n=1 Tax=Metarhizium acridum TaxID=92637 RepID=UPI001C6C95B8|nr:hypothetical protein J3458_015567 [Metarhizium acridum]